MKINFLKKENNFKKENFVFNPNFYWKLFIFCSFIMIILAFFFSYNLFRQTNEDSVLSNTNGGEEIPTIENNRIKQALNYFSEREKKSTEILNSPAPVVDPSL